METHHTLFRDWFFKKYLLTFVSSLFPGVFINMWKRLLLCKMYKRNLHTNDIISFNIKLYVLLANLKRVLLSCLPCLPIYKSELTLHSSSLYLASTYTEIPLMQHSRLHSSVASGHLYCSQYTPSKAETNSRFVMKTKIVKSNEFFYQ